MLSACAVIPDGTERYIDDRNALFETVPDAPAEWAARGVAGAVPTGDWLSQFNDPVMTQLVGEALRLMADDLPLVPLYRRKINWVMRPNIHVAPWPNDILELRWVRID